MNKYKFYMIISFSLLFQSVITAQNEWQLIGLENLRIEYVFAKGDTIWTTTRDSLYNYETYYSYNGGDAWSKLELNNPEFGGGFSIQAIDSKNTQRIYISDWHGRPWKTKDGGKSWEYLIPEAEPWIEGPWVKKIYISPHNKDVLFSIIVVDGQVDNLYRTTNGCKNWENVSAFAASSDGSEITFAFDPVDSTKMYVAADDNLTNSLFYASYNFGDNWFVLSEVPSLPKHIIIDWSNNNRIYIFPTYRSEDGGLNWVLVSNGLPYDSKYWSTIIDPKNSSVLYMSTSSGIFITPNSAEQWKLIGDSENLELIFSSGGLYDNLFIDSTTQKLYVGTSRGLYEYDLLTSIKVENEIIPNKFMLYQNYPNPFNPSTKIKYSIPRSTEYYSVQQTTLKVYDVLGREVTTLVNEQQKPGNYEVNFDANGLSSGIYYYRFVAGEFNQVKKMLLVR